MKYKKSLFLLACISLSSLALISCGETESTSSQSTNQTQDSTSSDDGKDDNGRTHVSGPSETDMPDIETPDIPSDDPIYDEDIDINPEWAKDVQTQPSNYNIYFYSATNAVRDHIWLWGGSGSGGIGLPVTQTNVEVEGISVTFSSIYLKSDTFYYCFSDWASSATSYFRLKMNQPFTGCKIKDLEGSTSNPNDITLPSPDASSSEPFNVYIIEKEDGDADAFTSVSAANDFLTDATPAVWPKDSTTTPSDVNIYYYSDNGNSNIYFWGGANAELPFTTTTTFDGIDLTFNAIYLTNGVKYNGYKGRWKYTNEDDSIHEAENTIISFTLKDTTSLSGCLLKNDDGTTKTSDITLPANTESPKNYYIVERNGSAKAYITLDALKAALDPTTPKTKTPAEETEAKDINIYYTASKSAGYNEDWATARGAFYGWDSSSADFAFNMTTTVSALEGIETYKFSTAFIEYNTEYLGYSDWSMDSTTETTFSFASIDEFKSKFSGFLIRNVGGSQKSPDASYDSTKLTADDNGKYNLYLVDDWASDTGNVCYVYYTLAELKTALGQ